MGHGMPALIEIIEDMYERFPRVTGLVLGIAMHPVLTAIIAGR